MGWKQYNEEQQEYGAETISLQEYVTTGHFAQATFENWESEFLQMGLFVLLTIWLRQKGSSESKDLNEKEPVDREPKSSPRAPYAVRRGGWLLKIYQNSLTVAFMVLFIFSFSFHAEGSYKSYVHEEKLKDEVPEPFENYMAGSRFWFESFQNWQSEFLAVMSIVFLSIYLRQKGSAQSKPVDTPHDEIE